jgi:membrane peptidoglycan carboxypeptidase
VSVPPPPPDQPPRRRPPTPNTGAGSPRYGLGETPKAKPAAATGPAGPQPPVKSKAKAKKKRVGWRRYTPTWRMIWVTCLTGFVLVVAGVAYLWFSTPVPNPSAVSISQATTVLYSDGSVLGNIGATNRVDVTDISQIPPVVREAVLAAEDRKFYSEPGISVTGIARAVLVDATGGSVQGGSTITQQYAKNAFLTQKRTLSRKLREVVIAIKLTQTESKNQVLLDYLNTIYFGRGASGIQAASHAYFGKDVTKLNAAEGAVLAAAIQRPSYFDPDVHLAASQARWTYVINGMIKEHWLTASPVYPIKQVIKYTPARVTGPNAFIIDAVQKELANANIDEDKLALGTTIVTTIDKNDQAAAIKAEDQQLNDKVKGLKTNDPPVGALVAMQPSDGAIRAMYGGQGSTPDGSCSARLGGCLNLATQGLFQPGSSFKPYVLATAEAQGSDGILTRWNGPAVLPDPPGADIHNDSGEVCNNCTLETALAKSVNTIYVPLARKVGPQNVALTAQSAGIPTSIKLSDAGLTTDRIALGVYPVHPIDQAVGYATFCNGGNRVTPFLVRSVKSRKGESLYKAKTSSTRTIAAPIAADVDYAMQQVVTSGTGTGAQLGNRPVAGKTGTTQNNTNAWFIGCTGPAAGTGQLVTSVWVGHAAKVTPLTDIPGFTQGVFGGTIPADIFHDFMTTALQGKPVVQFPQPQYVAGPKPASTLVPTPVVTTPSPTKTTASPKPTKTTKPAPTTTLATTTAPATLAPTTTAPPATSAAAPTTTTQAAPTTTTQPPATSAAGAVQAPAAGAGPSG